MRFDQCTNGNIFMHGWTKEQAVMSDHDKAILQELAKKMVAYAARPEEEARIQLWRDHNDLKDTRPWCCVPDTECRTWLRSACRT